MANNKLYGYTPNPSNEKDGNRLDRLNPYEFRKGMDYELTSMGCYRLAESTPEEREKSTEKVIKNLQEYGGYYSALIQYETEYRNPVEGISKPSFKAYLKEIEDYQMIEVDKTYSHDKMVEPKYKKEDYTVPFKTGKMGNFKLKALKESIRKEIRKTLNEKQLLTENVPCPIVDNCCHVGDDHNVYWGCPDGEVCDNINVGNGGATCVSGASIVPDAPEPTNFDKFNTGIDSPRAQRSIDKGDLAQLGEKQLTEDRKFTCHECRPGGLFGRGKCHHSASYLGTSRPADCISWEECLEECEGKTIDYGKVIDAPPSTGGQQTQPDFVRSMGENKLKEAIKREIRTELFREAKKLSEDRATQAAAKKDRLEKHKKMKDYEDSGKEFTDIDDTEPTKAQIKGIDKSIGDAKEALAQAIKKVKDLGPDIKKLAKETNEKIKKNPAGKADYLKTYTTNPDVKAFIKLRRMLKSADLL